MSNFTDFDALSCEPGVSVTFTRSRTEILSADLVIVPGTKATVSDLADLRAARLDEALLERAHRELPILEICSGYQMFGVSIMDVAKESTAIAGAWTGSHPRGFR